MKHYDKLSMSKELNKEKFGDRELKNAIKRINELLFCFKSKPHSLEEIDKYYFDLEELSTLLDLLYCKWKAFVFGRENLVIIPDDIYKALKTTVPFVNISKDFMMEIDSLRADCIVKILKNHKGYII